MLPTNSASASESRSTLPSYLVPPTSVHQRRSLWDDNRYSPHRGHGRTVSCPFPPRPDTPLPPRHVTSLPYLLPQIQRYRPKFSPVFEAQRANLSGATNGMTSGWGRREVGGSPFSRSLVGGSVGSVPAFQAFSRDQDTVAYRCMMPWVHDQNLLEQGQYFSIQPFLRILLGTLITLLYRCWATGGDCWAGIGRNHRQAHSRCWTRPIVTSDADSSPPRTVHRRWLSSLGKGGSPALPRTASPHLLYFSCGYHARVPCYHYHF